MTDQYPTFVVRPASIVPLPDNDPAVGELMDHGNTEHQGCLSIYYSRLSPRDGLKKATLSLAPAVACFQVTHIILLEVFHHSKTKTGNIPGFCNSLMTPAGSEIMISKLDTVGARPTK